MESNCFARCNVFIAEENPKKFCVHYKMTIATLQYSFSGLFIKLLCIVFFGILKSQDASRACKVLIERAADGIKILCVYAPNQAFCDTHYFLDRCAYRLNKRHNMVETEKAMHTQIFSQWISILHTVSRSQFAWIYPFYITALASYMLVKMFHVGIPTCRTIPFIMIKFNSCCAVRRVHWKAGEPANKRGSNRTSVMHRLWILKWIRK